MQCAHVPFELNKYFQAVLMKMSQTKRSAGEIEKEVHRSKSSWYYNEMLKNPETVAAAPRFFYFVFLFSVFVEKGL